MNSLFMPEQQEDVNLLDATSSFDENWLVFASGNNIYYLKHFHCEPRILRERDSCVYELCYNRENLHDVGYSGRIMNTLSDVLLVDAGESILNICSHYNPVTQKEHLYDLSQKGKVCRTYDRAEIADFGKNNSYCLESFDGKIFVGSKHDVHVIGSKYAHKSLGDAVYAGHNYLDFCKHEGNFYYGGFSDVCASGYTGVYGKMSKDGAEHGGNRDQVVRCMFSHEKKLYDVANSKSGVEIRRTFDSGWVYDFDGPINSVKSVPKHIIESYL